MLDVRQCLTDLEPFILFLYKIPFLQENSIEVIARV